jgi:membrane protein DedA with SNARE-associated domain
MAKYKINILDYLSFIKIQLIVICIFSTFLFLGIVGVIPSSNELLILLKNAFIQHGLWIIFLVSFFENLFGVNTYIPGAVVIFTGMALTVGDIPRAIATFISIFIPVIIANSINFYLGKRIGKISANVVPTTKMLTLDFIVKLWHPYLASIASFAIGAKNVKYITFLSLFFPISLLWNIFWGVLAYNYGAFLTKDSNSFLMIFVSYLIIWTIIDSFKFFRRLKSNQRTT